MNFKLYASLLRESWKRIAMLPDRIIDKQIAEILENKELDQYMKKDPRKIPWTKFFRGIARSFVSTDRGYTNADVEDATQSIIVGLFGDDGDYIAERWDPERAPLLSFISVRAKSLAQMWARKHRPKLKERMISPDEEEFYADVRKLQREVGAKDLVRKLRKEVERVDRTEGKRMVKTLDMLLQGESNSQIAKELGISPSNITRYMKRFKKILKDLAKEN